MFLVEEHNWIILLLCIFILTLLLLLLTLPLFKFGGKKTKLTLRHFPPPPPPPLSLPFPSPSAQLPSSHPSFSLPFPIYLIFFFSPPPFVPNFFLHVCPIPSPFNFPSYFTFISSSNCCGRFFFIVFTFFFYMAKVHFCCVLSWGIQQNHTSIIFLQNKKYTMKEWFCCVS